MLIQLVLLSFIGAAHSLSLPFRLATPSAAHLMFHEDNVGAICHFGMQTFVDQSARTCNATWSPDIFNPRQLDTDQWVAAAKSFGAKYIVLVADHFSGFSLWPTAAHKYSVASSPWRHGTGDVVADFIESCHRHEVRPAVYYSVHENWYKGVCNYNLSDASAQEAFEDMAMLQLQELADKYMHAHGRGLAELWFDAGVKQSSEFVQRVNDFVRDRLPQTATCHSCANMKDAHAVSWMGNELTEMPYPNWNANDGTCSHAGTPAESGYGVPDGTRWCPAHCDAVLRRHFWFWNNATYNETGNLNTVSRLLAMHLTSVGRGCNMILDMSPTDTGLLQQNDVDTYAGFGKGIDVLYRKSLVATASGMARGESVVTLPVAPAIVSRGAIEMRENMTEGQAIANYTIEYCSPSLLRDSTKDGLISCQQWKLLPTHNEKHITIGNRRIHYFADDAVTLAIIRVTVGTLQLASGEFALPHIRSVTVYDWSDPKLDRLLDDILNVN